MGYWTAGVGGVGCGLIAGFCRKGGGDGNWRRIKLGRVWGERMMKEECEG